MGAKACVQCEGEGLGARHALDDHLIVVLIRLSEAEGRGLFNDRGAEALHGHILQALLEHGLAWLGWSWVRGSRVRLREG